MTDTITPILTGRALWEARHTDHDALVQDNVAFSYAMQDVLGSKGFSFLTGDAAGGEYRKRYDARRRDLYDYVKTHEVEPELRHLIDEMEDEVYDFAGESFNQGMAFASVADRFRLGLLTLEGLTAKYSTGNA